MSVGRNTKKIQNIMTQIQQQKAARDFAQRWKDKGYEKGESQIFWSTLLTEVFGVEHVDTFLLYEQQVHLDHTSFIDAVIPSTHVMIEQKSIKKDLGEPIKQSDGTPLNPFQQAKRYAAELPYSQRPRWIVTCNFREFWVYDMEQPNGEPQKILLENLEKEYYRLQFLVDEGNEHIKQEQKVSEEAGKLVGLIYDALLAQYHEPESPETLRSLNILCVRLVFCLYAEDAGLFNSRTAFHDFLAQYPAKDLRRALKDLFETLDTPEDQRDPYLEDALKSFPYVNGGLFSNDTRLEIPQFTDELKELILSKASDDFDWSEISPTIFGAIFESTLNPETRRSGGMHYTSIANIHKVIDPLFLDDLKAEFDAIKSITNDKQQRQRLDAFQDKLASLTFFDPACGSGNFLTESYVSLRRLENQLILLRNKGQGTFGDIANPIKVDIHQFYGIEINDFAVSVATTALWIAEQQMLQETQKIVSFNVNPLPLKSYHNIHEGNALRLDWSSVIAPDRLNYIMGNPPFVGYTYQSKEQKEDLAAIMKGFGSNIDYVAGWYLKSAEMMMANPAIHAALVSTNSITQGEQVAAIWKPLSEQYGIHFDFAYHTFRWDSEADIKAHVHCVIIGFSIAGSSAPKRLYLSDGTYAQCANINGYLLDAPDVFIENCKKPLCVVPEMVKGSQPTDGGNLILSSEEKDEIVIKYPQIASYIHRFIGSDEFINNKYRYCLWLVNVSPSVLRTCPPVLERIEQVRQMRLSSPKTATQKWAEYPTLFTENRQPDSDYLLVPSVSSEKRRYIPIGYMTKDIVTSNLAFVVPQAGLYHFGVMTSNIHNAWMRAVCGRLEMRYRYSNTIVYNNFPWPTPTDEQRARIEATAQAILDARALYPDSSLADLYDEVAMPPELRRAHQENDRAVMAAYGFSTKMTESECVAKLFELYQKLTK